MRTLRLHAAAAYLVVYLLASYLGRQAVLPGTGLALFWPAAGVAALWMLRGSTRAQIRVDGLLLLSSTVLFNLALHMPLHAAVFFGVANLVQGLAVRLASSRLEGRSVIGPLPRRIATVRDLLDLALASLLAAVLSSTAGTTAAYLASGQWAWSTVGAWVVRNACGTLVVVAATMAVMTTLATQNVRWRGWRAALSTHERRFVLLELCLAASFAAVVQSMVFGRIEQLPIAYLCIAAAAWIGFRFSPLVAGVAAAPLGVSAVLCTLAGRGPFGVVPDLTLRAVIVQLFVVTTTCLLLLLSLAVAQREDLRHQAERSAAEADRRATLLHAVTESMLDGLAVVDADGRVVIGNPAAAQLIAPRVDRGRLEAPWRHGLFRPDGSDLAPEEMPHLTAIAEDQVVATDLLRVHPTTGAQTTLSVTAHPLDLAGTGRLAVMNFRDVSDDRAQTRNLEAFAAVAAHDLQGPLSAVLSWAELLSDQLAEHEGLDAERASLRHIERAGGRMQSLIGDLLSYTLAGSRPLQVETVSLDEVVDDVALPLVSSGAAEVVHGELGTASADPVLVRQLLANLIGNAVKYVPEGTRPRVEVSTLVLGDQVQVAICDNGIGIPDDERIRVFDNFYRATTSAAYPGTGLGLAICAGVVKRHGGTIAAQGRVDGPGTMMVFTLPVVRSEAQRDAGDTTSAEPPPGRTGSDTAVSAPPGPSSIAVAAPI